MKEIIAQFVIPILMGMFLIGIFGFLAYKGISFVFDMFNRKDYRSDFLDSFADSPIDELLSAAKAIGILSEAGGVLYLERRDGKRYYASTLGGFVESILNRYPLPANFENVAEFLHHRNSAYNAEFYKGMSRHEEILKALLEVKLRFTERQNREDYGAKRAKKIKQGIKLCKR